MDPYRLEFSITPQPDEATCGISCLHAVYRYFGAEIPLEELKHDVLHLKEGGTLAVYLGLHALRRGFTATIYTCDLQLFDPVWFAAADVDLAGKLQAQSKVKKNAKLRAASRAYVEFLEAGGRVEMQDLNQNQILQCLRGSGPVIAGLCSTWLYRCARERTDTFKSDDIAGYPTGHFVVLHGVDPAGSRIQVADPYLHRPWPGEHHYAIDTDRLIGAIHLGIMTNDAKLLVIAPGGQT